MPRVTLRADGSSLEDAPKRVVIDRSNATDRWRYTCPNGHVNWARTNSHIWCRGCSQANRHDNDVDPEHYEIHDNKTGEIIPWSAVVLQG